MNMEIELNNTVWITYLRVIKTFKNMKSSTQRTCIIQIIERMFIFFSNFMTFILFQNNAQQ